jgi:hypothetical protein
MKRKVCLNMLAAAQITWRQMVLFFGNNELERFREEFAVA